MPDPIWVAESTLARDWIWLSATFAPAVAASDASSAKESSALAWADSPPADLRCVPRLVRFKPTRIAISCEANKGYLVVIVAARGARGYMRSYRCDGALRRIVVGPRDYYSRNRVLENQLLLTVGFKDH